MTHYLTFLTRCASAILVCQACTCLCFGQSEQDGTEAESFAAVLAAAGIDLSEPVQDAESRVLFRLRSFAPDRLAAWAAPMPEVGGFRVGELYLLRGRLKRLTRTEQSGEPEEPVLSPDYGCAVELHSPGGEVTLRVPQVPREWLAHKELDEPVESIGVCVAATQGNEPALFVAPRVAWFPERGVDSGRLLLAAAGFDVGLLDEVRHRRRFVSEVVSDEGRAFYECLQTVNSMPLSTVLKPARQAVIDSAAAWRAELDQPGRPGAMAAAVIEAADDGRSSVAPLFLQPEKEAGKLVLLTGLARRAVRVALDPAPAGVAGAERTDGYYEVDLFTPDSQNLPVVCCVPTLPAGFPVGEQVRETVRVPAFFFKSWRYRSRRDPAEDRATQLYAPVVIAPGLTWLKQPASAGGRGSWAWGAAAVALLGGLWWALSAVAKSDRRERRRVDAILEQAAAEPSAGDAPHQRGAR